MSIGGPHEVLPPHDRYNQQWLVVAPRPPHPGRRPPGALAQHRSGCMITASEVSKKPGAVQNSLIWRSTGPSNPLTILV